MGKDMQQPPRDPAAGWATNDATADVVHAHQLTGSGTDQQGQEVYGSLCGQVTGSHGWTLVGPGTTRCPACQDLVAGTPD